MSFSPTYRAFLLRLWRTADGGWRAALVDPLTGEQAAFATLERCWEHLQRLAPCASPSGPAANPAAPQEMDLD